MELSWSSAARPPTSQVGARQRVVGQCSAGQRVWMLPVVQPQTSSGWPGCKAELLGCSDVVGRLCRVRLDRHFYVLCTVLVAV